MKKFVKISLITVIIIICVIALSGAIFIGINFAKYSYLELDDNKLSSSSLSIEIYDCDNRPIKQDNTFNNAYAKLDLLPCYVKESFIAIEDKNFYNHNGLNYKRIIKAGINNILSKSLKEGASTISQQLIKNTHLSSEKTFQRKIKEIILTKKLEKSYSKDEILEKYLNAIYYGNNCYGLENASNYYFSKSSKDLSLEESALLAGMIKSPNKYSPITNPSDALNRRNLVLSEMLKSEFISEEECLTAKNKPISLNLQTENTNRLNSYSEASLDEACKILNLPAKEIALRGYKIHTYLSKETQDNLHKALLSEDFKSADHAGIVLDAKEHTVKAFEGSSAYKILNAKRQPGSTIKPILVYAPAINEDIISPSTQILDEQLVLTDYNPKNVDGKYRGYVSITEAISKSINIPAIKVLSYVGIDKAKSYAEDMGIEFDKEDHSYAIALGGMRYGVTIKQLAESYSAFPCLGKYAEAKFIEYITDSNGKILYHNKCEEKKVLREDCAYLMTTMLEETAKSGTAKVLKDLDMPIAAKTGTVGKGKENLDAWCVAYTPNEVCVTWVGNLDNTPIDVAGGNQPARCIKKYFESIKKENLEAFTMPDSIIEKEIDLISLENAHKVELASPNTPERYKTTALFSIFNYPKDIANNFTELSQTTFSIKNLGKGKILINFIPQRNVNYKIYDDKKLIQEISDQTLEQNIMVNIDSETLNIKESNSNTFNENIQTFRIKKEEQKQKAPQKKKWFV